MRQRIVESVLTAVLLGILGTAWSTYNEVKELRHEVNELRRDLDWLMSETNDHVQESARRK